MTAPFARAKSAAAEVDKAGKFIKKDWQRHHDIIASPDLSRAHEMHVDGLRHGWLILDAVSDMPADDVTALHALHAKSPAAFDAIMVHVRIELARPDAPAEETKAA